jgi:hypothetical protein
MAARLKTWRAFRHARHDFPQCRCKIQLLMDKPPSCAGLRRNLAENPAPYRTIPHRWAFRPINGNFGPNLTWRARPPDVALGYTPPGRMIEDRIG